MLYRMYLLLAIQLAAFWPVWGWYLQRMSDGSDEPWGIAAVLTAAWFLLRSPLRSAPNQTALAASAAAALLYTLAYSSLPMLALALLAVASVAFAASGLFLGRAVHGGVLGLLVLSLPLIASLQFYLGYPIRLLTAAISAQLISGLGYPVEAQGTLLIWAGELIAVDAPCSGVKMLWTGMYLNFTIACINGLGLRSTWLSYLSAGALIFAGNVIRAAILFFPEAGILSAPAWFHSAAGLAVFAVVAAGIYRVHQRLAPAGGLV